MHFGDRPNRANHQGKAIIKLYWNLKKKKKKEWKEKKYRLKNIKK